jgi:hypothetical protein
MKWYFIFQYRPDRSPPENENYTPRFTRDRPVRRSPPQSPCHRCADQLRRAPALRGAPLRQTDLTGHQAPTIGLADTRVDAYVGGIRRLALLMYSYLNCCMKHMLYAAEQLLICRYSATGLSEGPASPSSSNRRKPSSSRMGTPSSTALSYFDPGESPATT